MPLLHLNATGLGASEFPLPSGEGQGEGELKARQAPSHRFHKPSIPKGIPLEPLQRDPTIDDQHALALQQSQLAV